MMVSCWSPRKAQADYSRWKQGPQALVTKNVTVRTVKFEVWPMDWFTALIACASKRFHQGDVIRWSAWYTDRMIHRDIRIVSSQNLRFPSLSCHNEQNRNLRIYLRSLVVGTMFGAESTQCAEKLLFVQDLSVCSSLHVHWLNTNGSC